MAKSKADAGKICGEVAARLGYELVDTALEKEGARLYLRAYIDKPGGVTLEDCEKFHRAVQPLVEHIEYDFLEVTSPGIDRPLKTDQDLQAAVGEEVVIRLFKQIHVAREHRGRLSGFDRDTVRATTPAGEREFLRKDVARMERWVDLSVLAQGPEAPACAQASHEYESADMPANAGEAGSEYGQPEN